MNQNGKQLIRKINKIYPPQIAQSNGKLIVYNPLQHWVQSHSSSCLLDLIEIQSNFNPLFLNNSSEQIIMQNDYQIFVESTPNQWMKTIKKEIISQQQIVSQTTKINHNYININKFGKINVWNNHQQMGFDNNQDNPQSLKDLSKCNQSKEIPTTINSQLLVKQYRHGYNFAPIMFDTQNVYTLNWVQDRQNNSFTKILATDVEGQQGESSFYQCFLPSTINKLIDNGNIICAYGGQNGLLIDKRSQAIICDFNNEESSSINCITYDQHHKIFYVCRDKKLLQLDMRSLSLQQTPNTFEEQIDNLELFNQEQKSYCAFSFKTSNQITIAQL